MFGSSILEVAIGVVFVYLLLSLICTALNEAIAALLQKRGRNLFEGIKNLLDDDTFTGLAHQVYDHGLIGVISRNAANPDKPTRLPSYMSPANFSLALLDILGTRGIIGMAAQYSDLLTQAGSADDTYEKARQAAAAAPGDPQLAAAADQARAAREQAQAALEAIADRARTAYDQALKAANGAPGDAELAARAVEAKTAMNHISAALKMLDARRAAMASAGNAKDMILLLDANTVLKEALDYGRAIAAQYPDPLGNIEAALRRLPEGNTKESLLVLVDKTRRDVNVVEHQAEAFRRNVEEWFNDAMNRVGGWYKRWTQQILLFLAVIVVVISNADTVMLVQRLSQDNALRASLTAAAQDAVKSMPAPVSTGSTSPGAVPSQQGEDPRIQFVLQKAQDLKLPVGWSRDPKDPGYFHPPQLSLEFAGWALYKVFGLIISIFAVSLGAPFWFDTLSKFINLRSAGTPPGETKKSAPQPGG